MTAAATGTPTCLWSAGFIANRVELLESLRLPHDTPDPELAAVLVSRLGADEAARRLAGQFSFVLWDSTPQRMIAVRDPVGANDLAWRRDGTRLVLGGVRDLTGPSPAASDLDLEALAGHLCGTGPPPGRTMFREIGRLERAELLEVTPSALVRRPYWSPGLRPVLQLPSDQAYAERLRDVLRTVVGQYGADETTGITLSGGLDSTSVAAMLCATAPPSLPRALTWISPEITAADESAPAAAVCRRLGLDTTTIRADLHWPLSGGIPAGTPEEPDLTYYPEIWDATLDAARAAGVEVLLTGASGDNLFGGEVSAYPDLLLALRWGHLASQIRSHLQWTELGAARLLRLLLLTPVRRAWFGAGRLRPPAWLTGPARRAAEGVLEASRMPGAFLPGRRQLLVQLRERLPALAVAQLGRRGAARGVELRHPLLDHRLIELAASLPADQLFRAGVRKHVLRNAMRDDLPDEVLSRRRKIIPLEIFHRGVRERGRDIVEELLADMRAADLGLVEPERLREGYQSYVAGTSRDSRFWHALTLEGWLRTHL